MRTTYKSILLWTLLILLFFSLFHVVQRTGPEAEEINFSNFLTQVDAKNVEAVTVKGLDYEGAFKDGSKFKTRGPAIVDSALLDRMTAGGVELRYEREEQNSLWVQILVQWLPMIVIFVIFIFFMRQLQSGGGKAMSFGKSKARRLSEENNKITFADVAGIDEAKEELEEIMQ